jgi:hypothetical protein
MHLAASPVVFGTGERLLHGIDLPTLGMKTVQLITGEGASHFLLSR